MPNADGSLTAAEIAALYALIKAQSSIREQLLRIAVAAALAPLRLVNWFDPADVAEAVDQALRVVLPTQLRMAQVVDASMARALSIVTGRPTRPTGAVDVRQLRRWASPSVARLTASTPPVLVEPDGELDLSRFFDELDDELDEELEQARRRRQQDLDEELEREHDRARRDEQREADAQREARLVALDPMEPYVRIGAQYRWLRSQGADESQAREVVAERVERVVDTDIALAQRAQESQAIRRSSPRVRGYRRILQPELGGGGPPCGLCVVAADRVYSREDLKPIHSRCRCAVLPITTEADPGLVLNGEDLDRIYRAAGGTAGRRLKGLRVGIGEHGELGPVLFPYGRGFRDAEEADADRRVGSLERRLQGLERSTTALERKLAAGESRLRPLVDYQNRQIDQIRQELSA